MAKRVLVSILTSWVSCYKFEEVNKKHVVERFVTLPYPGVFRLLIMEITWKYIEKRDKLTFFSFSQITPLTRFEENPKKSMYFLSWWIDWKIKVAGLEFHEQL